MRLQPLRNLPRRLTLVRQVHGDGELVEVELAVAVEVGEVPDLAELGLGEAGVLEGSGGGRPREEPGDGSEAVELVLVEVGLVLQAPVVVVGRVEPEGVELRGEARETEREVFRTLETGKTFAAGTLRTSIPRKHSLSQLFSVSCRRLSPLTFMAALAAGSNLCPAWMGTSMFSPSRSCAAYLEARTSAESFSLGRESMSLGMSTFRTRSRSAV